MTDIGRNQPCPCGSGRKYKHCCAGNGNGASATGGGVASTGRTGFEARVPPEAIAGHEWQADILPLPIGFEEDPHARPTSLLVTANELVLASEVLSAPLGEYDAIAAKLAKAILAARQTNGIAPPRVVVRWKEVAEELRRQLPDGIPVEVAPVLEDLKAAARSLLTQIADFPDWPPISNPESWLAWGLPRPVIAEIFEAAAAFHVARPWRVLDDVPPLIVLRPDDRVWTAATMGSGGEEFGFTMYRDLDDYLRTINAEGESDTLSTLVGRTIALGFARRDELPRRIQREIASNGWRIAAPTAYPIVLPLNTPAGGISRADADDLLAILRTVPAFVAEHGHRFHDDIVPARAVTVHPPTGTIAIYDAMFPWIEDAALVADDLDEHDLSILRELFDENDVLDDGSTDDNIVAALDDLASWHDRLHGGFGPGPSRRLRGTPRPRRGREVGGRPFPKKGTAEAVPAVLEDAFARMVAYARTDTAATPDLVDGAQHLLREYARQNPSEISRVLKPEVWAAAALHAAFQLGSTAVRATTLLARRFGVSDSAVSVRSSRLRQAVPWPAARPSESQDEDADVLALWDLDTAPESRSASGTIESTKRRAESEGTDGKILPFIPRSARDSVSKPAPPDAATRSRDEAPAAGASRKKAAARGKQRRRIAPSLAAANPTTPVRDDSATPDFTPLQGQYLTFIYYYTKVHRRPPSEIDLRDHFGVTPPSVHNMILTLERKGLISRVPGQARSISVLVKRERLPELE